MALAKGAKLHGATLLEDVIVEGVRKRGRFVCGVRTNRGDIECEFVVNCCGMWGRQFGALAGVHIPLQAAEHYYLLTEKVDGISRDWPVIEDPASYGYYREEGGGMLIGLFEPVCAPWNVQGIPRDSSFAVITPDWDRVAPFLDKAMGRVPSLKHVGMKKLFCGPESFTPDLAPCIGEAPELRNYFVAAGMNSIGILSGGGIGRTVAHWVMTGLPDADVTGMNVDRLQEF
jgi:4-methylaminobutanoate oxidase (formaldehyde-forming)